MPEIYLRPRPWRHGRIRRLLYAVVTALVLFAATAVVAYALQPWLRGATATADVTGLAHAAMLATSAASAPAAAAYSPAAAPTPTPPASQSASATAAASPSSAASDNAKASHNAWTAKYRGLLVRGFKPEPGYKAVALTFDDGPNHETGYIIRTLEKYGGKATFFDTGKNMLKHNGARQVVAISAAGFELGDHTQSHMPNDTSSIWHKSYAHDVAEITAPDKLIAPYVPFKTLWLRPPGGGIDAVGVRAAANTGHLVVNWTVDSNDSHGGPRTPDYIYSKCTAKIRSGDVILLHVTHPESMTALPRICAELRRQGFKLVTLSELARHSTPLTQRIPR